MEWAIVASDQFAEVLRGRSSQLFNAKLPCIMYFYSLFSKGANLESKQNKSERCVSPEAER